MRVIISGGGSGGHIFPAIAIANALMKRNPEAQILFVGANGKIEMEKVSKAGYEIKGLNISGFHRKKLWRNISFPPKLLISLLDARKIIKEFRPNIAIGVGGYASGPILYMASAMRIPSLIQEQNSYPGITNKLLAGRVKKICVAYPGMEKFFPAEKIVFTGNPVRKDIFENTLNSEDAKASFGLDGQLKTVLIFGGSLGARTLNNAIKANFEIIEKAKHINVIWQVGKLYHEEFKNCDVAQLPNVKLLPFIERMDMAYAAADVIVCRAGALTISELALVAKPAILVPSPNVAEDHQTKNAMALVREKGAVIVRDEEVKNELIRSMMQLLNDEEQQNALSIGIKSFARPDSARLITDEILNLTSK